MNKIYKLLLYILLAFGFSLVATTCMYGMSVSYENIVVTNGMLIIFPISVWCILDII